jgi:hypothetical protein
MTTNFLVANIRDDLQEVALEEVFDSSRPPFSCTRM